jgi:hypothetical protein
MSSNLPTKPLPQVQILQFPQVSETQRQCATKRCNEVIEPVISQIPSGLCKKKKYKKMQGANVIVNYVGNIA